MDAFLFRLKAAQRDLIARCGGIARTEAIVHVSKSQVGRWNSPTDSDLMMLGAVMALEADCGEPLVTAVLAEANGRRLTDPEKSRQADVNVLAAHSEVMRHGAEVANSVSVAIADGTVTPAEASIVDRTLAEMERAVSAMRRSLAVVKANGGDRSELRVVRDGE